MTSGHLGAAAAEERTVATTNAHAKGARLVVFEVR